MSDFKSDSSVNRILKNGMFTGLRFGVYTLSGIIFIPFLIKQYGSGTYGLIALAGFLTQYVGLVSGCVGTSIARFLGIALNKNDWQQANEIFNTAIVANLGFICIQLPLFALGVWKLDWLIDFPPEIGKDFRILVICNIAIFFLNIMKGAFFTPIQAANRLDISEKFNIASQILRLVLLFGLISGIGAKLWVIGVVDLGISLLIFASGLLVYRRLIHRNLVFRKQYITRKWIKPILSMAGWALVSALGFALFVKTDVWLINRFVSKEMAGVYAALLVWPNFVKQIGGLVGGLVAPVFTIDFAKENHERMRQTCLLSSQILSYGTAYGCGVFVVAAPGLIRLWLGDAFVEYAHWVQLMVGQLAFTISGSIIWHIFVTIGKTKYMGIGNLIPGTLNILLSLFLIYIGYGALGVLWGTIGAVFLKENLLFPIWVSKETGIPYRKFFLIYVRAGLVFGLVLGIGYLVSSYTSEFSLAGLTIMALLPFGATLLLIYFLTNRDERDAVYLFVKTKLLKRSVAS